MNRGLIATRYATAFYEIAKEKAMDDVVYKEMKFLFDVFVAVPEINKYLENPTLTEVDKLQIFKKVLPPDACEATFEFIAFVISHKREDFFVFIALKYIEIYRKKSNIHVATLITAAETDLKTDKRLVEMIENKTGGTVELERQTDQGIIGGFIIEVDNMLWDASIAGRLKQMRDKYSKQN